MKAFKTGEKVLYVANNGSYYDKFHNRVGIVESDSHIEKANFIDRGKNLGFSHIDLNFTYVNYIIDGERVRTKLYTKHLIPIEEYLRVSNNEIQGRNE